MREIDDSPFTSKEKNGKMQSYTRRFAEVASGKNNVAHFSFRREQQKEKCESNLLSLWVRRKGCDVEKGLLPGDFHL